MPKAAKTQSDSRPVLFIGVGRQRVGKTTFLNTVIQAMREQGAEFVIWNADLLNVTYNLPLFHDDVLEPPSADFEDVKSWLEERIQDQIEGQYNAFLDVGGGDTPLSRLVREIPIVQTLEKQGIAILIVEFARQAEESGLPITDAALKAARTILGPILVTSFAFILGVARLVVSTGAGSELRQSL